MILDCIYQMAMEMPIVARTAQIACTPLMAKLFLKPDWGFHSDNRN
jgi:hypothetical protein